MADVRAPVLSSSLDLARCLCCRSRTAGAILVHRSSPQAHAARCEGALRERFQLTGIWHLQMLASFAFPSMHSAMVEVGTSIAATTSMYAFTRGTAMVSAFRNIYNHHQAGKAIFCDVRLPQALERLSPCVAVACQRSALSKHGIW
jgi:hypothetical protein